MRTFITPIEYWQVRANGDIMECPAAPRSEEWHRAYRRVRLYHHPESDCVFVEDYFISDELQRRHWAAQAEEVPLDVYKYWKMIYDNPDI